jgi:ribosomal protein S17E
VKPFYSGRIAPKLMTKHTSLLTKDTAFEHNSTKLRENGKSDKMAAKYHSRSKKPDFIWSKTKDLEGNILQTA